MPWRVTVDTDIDCSIGDNDDKREPRHAWTSYVDDLRTHLNGQNQTPNTWTHCPCVPSSCENRSRPFPGRTSYKKVEPSAHRTSAPTLTNSPLILSLTLNHPSGRGRCPRTEANVRSRRTMQPNGLGFSYVYFVFISGLLQ